MTTSYFCRRNLAAITLAALSLTACGAPPSDSSVEETQATPQPQPPPLGGKRADAPSAEPKVEDPKPVTVGGGGAEYTLVAPSGDSIFAAYGGFSGVTRTSGENDTIFGAGNYSAQMNTNYFATPCNQSFPYYYMGNQCQGWAQFVYQADPFYAQVFVEYWILNLGRNSCPAGWTGYENPVKSGGYQLDCYLDSPHTAAPVVPIASLGSLTVSGSLSHSGIVATVSTGSGPLITSTASDYFGLAYGGSWTSAEFNVFGYGNGSAANFSILSSITVGISAAYGTAANNYSIVAPTCGSGSFTGETNNLFLGACTPATGIFGIGLPGRPATVVRYPSIQFTESEPIIRILPGTF